MYRILSISCVLFLSLPGRALLDGQETITYPIPPEAVRQDGVPRGQLIQGVYRESRIYPGTERDYWLYVPAQPVADNPAPLMVFQDGKGYCNDNRGARAHIVFDNLIHEGAMPPTIGLFINPGVVPAAHDKALPRFNRSFEYDDVSDRYARFLIEEMIPFVESKHGVNISSDPNDRGICGASSGGICAFAVAWNRPDAFRRVYSMIGTYVGLRGGDELATLVRKTEPKPLRIFLQDGTNDLNIYCGDWWMENQTMNRALRVGRLRSATCVGRGRSQPQSWRCHFSAGDALAVERLSATGGHASGPIVEPSAEMLVDGADWELIGEGYQWAEGLAVTRDGTLYFSDVPASKIYRVLPGANPKCSWRDGQGQRTGVGAGRTLVRRL